MTMPSGVFTIEEANQLVPKLTIIFDGIFDLNRRIRFHAEDVRLMLEMWGNEVLRKGHIDNPLYERKIRQVDEFSDRITQLIQNMKGMGCILKDLNTGLVDFPFDNNGSPGFLCWKHGEKEITHWHGLNEGFTGRKSIKELVPAPTG